MIGCYIRFFSSKTSGGNEIVETRIILRMTMVALMLGYFWSTARAVEPEKQPIYSNIVGGLLCGTAITNQCTVPTGRRLIIEYVSGYAFQATSASQTISISMAITDSGLGLNGSSFHTFVATKTNTAGTTDVFVFSEPLRMMLNPRAKFYFSGVASVAVSGYLVNSQ